MIELQQVENLDDFTKIVQIGGGKSITVTNFKFAKIFKAKKIFRKIIGDFNSIFAPSTPGPISARGFSLFLDIEQLLDKNEQEIRDLIKLETGFDDKILDSMNPDIVIRLIVAILEVNAGFFVRRLAPEMRKIMAGVGSLVSTK